MTVRLKVRVGVMKACSIHSNADACACLSSSLTTTLLLRVSSGVGPSSGVRVKVWEGLRSEGEA